MSSPSPAKSDFQLWDTAWSSLPADGVQLFTRGTPRNIHAFRHQCFYEDLWPLIEHSGGKGRYLEIGAGRGTTSMYLASRGCDVTLLDYVPTGLEVARRNFAREGLAAPHTVIADARKTGLPESAYDCVYSLGLLEHFDDPKPVMDEMLRVLKPGGYVFTVVIPELPASVRYLSYGLFAPWKLAPRLVPRPVASLVKRMLGRKETTIRPNRTEFDAHEYIRMLPQDKVTELFWCYYSPYHEIYSNRLAERFILVPAYRLHRALRRQFVSGSPRTSRAFAAAFLLTFRKK